MDTKIRVEPATFQSGVQHSNQSYLNSPYIKFRESSCMRLGLKDGGKLNKIVDFMFLFEPCLLSNMFWES